MHIFQKINGKFWKIINILTFSIVTLITKSFVVELSIFQIFFSFNFICLLIVFFCYKVSFKTYPKIIFNYLSIIRSVINIAALGLWFVALRMLDLSDATIISYTTPIFGILIGFLIFKEHIHKNIIFSLIIGSTGCYIIIQPNLKSQLNGIIACFGSAFLWAIHDSIIKLQGNRNQTIFEAMFQTVFLNSLISLPFAIDNWVVPSTNMNYLLLACGILSFINLYALGAALEKEKISVLMPITFLRIIFILIGGFLFYQEVIEPPQLLGLILILISNYLIMKRLT